MSSEALWVEKLRESLNLVDRELAEAEAALQQKRDIRASIAAALEKTTSVLIILGASASYSNAPSGDWQGLTLTAAVERVVRESPTPLGRKAIADKLASVGVKYHKVDNISAALSHLRSQNKVDRTDDSLWLPSSDTPAENEESPAVTGPSSLSLQEGDSFHAHLVGSH